MTLVGIKGMLCYQTVCGKMIRMEVADKLPKDPSPAELEQAIADSAALDSEWNRNAVARR
jgi:hypothetical protein